MKNGQKGSFEARILSFSTIPSKTSGNYTMQVLPVGEAAKIVPEGRISFSEPQLRQIAGKLGVSNYKTAIIVLGKGGCSVLMEYEFCKSGEQSPDNPDVTYTTDWYRLDKVSATFELSEIAEKTLTHFQTALVEAAEIESSKKDAESAIKARLALIAERNRAKAQAAGEEDEDDFLNNFNPDPDDEEEEEKVPSTEEQEGGKTKRGRAKA